MSGPGSAGFKAWLATTDDRRSLAEYMSVLEGTVLMWERDEAKLEAMGRRLAEARRLIEDVGGRDDWEGRAADWLGITAAQEEGE